MIHRNTSSYLLSTWAPLDIQVVTRWTQCGHSLAVIQISLEWHMDTTLTLCDYHFGLVLFHKFTIYTDTTFWHPPDSHLKTTSKPHEHQMVIICRPCEHLINLSSFLLSYILHYHITPTWYLGGIQVVSRWSPLNTHVCTTWTPHGSHLSTTLDLYISPEICGSH